MNAITSHISHGVNSALFTIGEGVSLVSSEVKKGIRYVGEGPSRAAYDIYDLRHEGFEKWTKAAIANLKLIGRIKHTNVFNAAIETLEGQKNLYYATKFIGSACDFIQRDKLTKKVSLTIPKYKEGTNWVAVLYGIGNFLDTARFLQKHEVVAFQTVSRLGAAIGSIKISYLKGKHLEQISLDQIPVLSNVFYSPKDIFIFAASGIEISRFVREFVNVEGETGEDRTRKRKEILSDVSIWLKLTGSIGKMILIGCGSRYGTAFWFTLVDVITQNAGLIRYWKDRSRDREVRFNNPAVAA
ncbi:hypothetical protein [Candidatus Protochlamydia sp. W-9]|uniref:hypothetical protein n=1 Tax=Candidatus Protochlamydia sp. W-9 TaxID=1785087 RepID=UPI00096AC127|nr:hypothetical protein [Candidatus Protochlamydia sp. W-9]